MKRNRIFSLVALLTASLLVPSLQAQSLFSYEPSAEHPFGLPNPDMPKEHLDFAPLIGECDCKSVSRIDQNTWADTVSMVWRFKYIMNGMGIQDETLKEDGQHSGSIRQFVADSARWFVHYYSSQGPTATLPVWEGNRSDKGDIILYRDQKAPNGTEGDYKLTFSEISSQGFTWLGEWVNKGETFSYPTWKIFCTKRTNPADESARAEIMQATEKFSRAYEAGDNEFIANCYTTDGKIFPGNSDIVEGRPALKEWWKVGGETKVLRHKVSPLEITFSGDYAYDYGYYEGETQNTKGEVSPFKGKYIIVWKNTAEGWKIYLDIWNGM